jgi:hypothetical protein
MAAAAKTLDVLIDQPAANGGRKGFFSPEGQAAPKDASVESKGNLIAAFQSLRASATAMSKKLATGGNLTDEELDRYEDQLCEARKMIATYQKYNLRASVKFAENAVTQIVNTLEKLASELTSIKPGS